MSGSAQRCTPVRRRNWYLGISVGTLSITSQSAWHTHLALILRIYLRALHYGFTTGAETQIYAPPVVQEYRRTHSDKACGMLRLVTKLNLAVVLFVSSPLLH